MAGTGKPLETNHLFANNVRFLSMASVIVLHSAGVLELAQIDRNLSIALVIPFKFATIGFFVISGFLLGERIDRCKPVEYFTRRFRKVFLPWSLWFALTCALLVVREFTRHGPRYSNTGDMLRTAFSISRFLLYDSVFWFVPNLLICIAILLICRRFLYSVKFGLVLLAVNLVYVANIYALWFSSNHSRALFAYVFYLWLGSYAAKNFNKISNFLAQIPATAFVAATLVTGIAAYCESHLLAALSRDTMNTLRLSNQIFSISVVLLIFKFRRAAWPGFIDVRRHTFGLYLSHAIVLVFFMKLAKNSRQWMSASIGFRVVEGVILWIAISVATYMSCLILTTWLASQPSLKWVVGLGPKDSPPRASLNVTSAHGFSRS